MNKRPEIRPTGTHVDSIGASQYGTIQRIGGFYFFAPVTNKAQIKSTVRFTVQICQIKSTGYKHLSGSKHLNQKP